MNDAPVLSVVIPSWNTKDYLAACLSTLAAAEKPASEVIVVENGSRDGSCEYVRAEHPEVRLLANAENEGFARGSNQGMRAARGRYVLLLNTDTEVAPDALAKLVRFLEEHPEYGAVAPRLVHKDGTTQRTVQEFPSLKTALFFSTPLERWFPDSRELRRYFMRDWDQESSRDIDQPPAAVLLLRKCVLDEVGLFDEELWLFYNDVDLAKRMRAAGWKTRYLAEATVLHHVGGSTSKFADFVATWQRDRLRYYRKHHGRFGVWWLKACVTLTLLDWLATQLTRRVRGRPVEPLGPMLAGYRTFLAQ
ncbi:MAG: glycosyltransferase family 2 protein [Planctomycetes bacterium]|nr:glycosyltransferase family 2 protein [Planctomycetota bacterium]